MTALTDLTRTLGSELTGLLATDRQRSIVQRVFDLFAAEYGPGITRAWLVGMNPHLDTAPILAIADGRDADVLAAARAHIEGAAA